MKNNSSQSRFSKITAKVVVILLAVVLSLSVLPALSADIFPEAGAAVEYGVAANTSPETISSELARLKKTETEVDVILQGDINLASYPSGIEIPEGLTVNFYMAGNSISYSNSARKLSGVCAFVNYGTLNIYAGNRANPTGSKASISLANDTGHINPDNPDNAMEFSYNRAEAIQNYGELSVNAGVSVNVNMRVIYVVEGRLRDAAFATVAIAGINNMATDAYARINGATISAIADTYAVSGNQGEVLGKEPAVCSAYVYGVYGGDVDVISTSAISATAYTGITRQDSTGGQTKGAATAVAYGICTSGQVYVAGGTISYAATSDHDDNAADSGTRHVYQGGICYIAGGVAPQIYDCTIPSTPFAAFTGDGDGTKLYREAPVATATTLPLSPQAIFSSTTNNFYQQQISDLKITRPAGVDAGVYTDECGNIYTCTSSSTDGSHPDAINRGALGDNQRVHVVYRYWTDTTRKTLDTSVIGKGGTVGYTYTPLDNDENAKIVAKLLNLKGLNNTKLQVPSGSALTYENGADPWNTYYWHLWGLSWAPATTVFSDYNIALPKNVQVFKGFGGTAGTSNKSANVTNGPIYIFVDYVKEAPTDIRAELPAGNTATTIYTGSRVLPSDFNLKINDPVDRVDITGEYNLDGNQTGLINVKFSYTGTNAAGEEESGDNGLPVNAGTYTVNLHIDESLTYSTDAKTSKNRNAVDFQFTLIIGKASAKRVFDSLDPQNKTLDEVTVTYGELLKDALAFNTEKYKAELLNNNDTQTVVGNFSFADAADGSMVKNAGTGTINIVWSPESGAAATNYKETTFSVKYTVERKKLYIIPKGASVVYGESELAEDFTSELDGLISQDDTNDIRTSILGSLIYEVQTGGEYKVYQPGVFQVGTHVISPKFSTKPAILNNYTTAFKTGEDNPAGVLTVTKRPVKLIATAINRDYIPGNENVDVKFSILEGLFISENDGPDKVELGIVTGTVANPNAGANKQVYGINASTAQPALGGEKGGNYKVESVLYGSDDGNLYVTINKATPDAPVPTIPERNYKQNVKLKDISLANAPIGSVTGTWSWVAEETTPSVKVSRYQAVFSPEDKNNYVDKYVDVVINVKPTPVVVTYQATVSYGDNMPNITEYTYISEIDDGFDISKVTTSGNITPRTDYQMGSPVKTGGYPVTISAPNYIDVDGNYTFSVRNGVITVKPRVITFTEQYI